MKLSKLLSSLESYKAANFREREIVSVECDSRRVRNGSVFVAIPGIDVDGTGFVPDALKAGAAAIVAQRHTVTSKSIPMILVPDARAALSRLAGFIHGCPSTKMHVVGVTGTNGKTTTSYLLRAILTAAGDATGLIGTVGCEYAGRFLPIDNTTPGPVELQHHLEQMRAAGVEYAVMEVSSHALTQRRVRDVTFEAAIYTNLSHEHLDYHGTLEEYLAAKGLLFQQLGANAVAAINADDRGGRQIIEKTRARVITYGLHEGMVRGHVDAAGLEGATFEIRTPAGSFSVAWPLIGVHNIYNALAAAACAFSMGIHTDAIRRGLEEVETISGRLERVDCGQPFHVLVDYAHTDDALNTVLANLSELKRNRILTVFGCGGDRDRTKRPKMGAAVERWSDRFWVTSDNPRGEDPEAIIHEVLTGIGEATHYETEPDRHTAIRKAIAAAEPDDIVLIAGKGHEARQVLSDRVIPFDDRIVAAQALQELQHSKASVAINAIPKDMS